MTSNFKNYSNYTAVIVGTGPSINEEQIGIVKKAREEDKCRIFTMNNSYQLIKPDVHFSCNYQWWDHYFKNDPNLTKLKKDVDMWTWNEKTAKKYGINHVPGKWQEGVSTDPKWIHFGHGSGFEMLGVCIHYHPNRIVLLGYDLKFPKGYNGKKKVAGGDRHYFGEYPKELQHWSVSPNSVDNEGRLIGLIKMYDKVKCKIPIINSTPDSALKCFPYISLKEVL